MIQAIIDIGSNTVRMAIYEIKDKNIDFLMKKKHMVGLAWKIIPYPCQVLISCVRY